MSIPTIAERKAWWVKAYAFASLHRSLESCQLMLERVHSITDPLYLPLAVSVHAFYCRPFQQQRGAGRLPDDYIPENWRGVHTALITFRNKVLVHTDADTVEQAGEPLNNVVYTNNGNAGMFLTQDIRPMLSYYADVAQYLPLLIARISEDIALFHHRFGELIPREGVHLLTLTGSSLFTPFDSTSEDSIQF